MSGAEWNWWNYAGVSTGLILMFLSLYPVSRRVLRRVSGSRMMFDWQTVSAYAKALWLPLLALSGLVIVVVGMIVALIYYDPPKKIWAHPTLSAAEQKKAKAECEMRAIEVGGSGPRIGSARYEYEAACLNSMGFESKKVKR